MNETLNIEPAEIYETPLLGEVGDFADLTQGAPIGPVEGTHSYMNGADSYMY
ncbi:lasso RiPP family leader peptide-containing protein [Nocardia sp. NPDC060259]|uniref:lasso RiPP family leader peptide-containing protein n=1 Tax=Nocardia sp. NPDC060259 TaxID=3347088 RepID=UPI0036588EED